mgnify:CR=1 FL=1
MSEAEKAAEPRGAARAGGRMTDPEPFAEDLRERAAAAAALSSASSSASRAIREQLGIFLEAARRRGEAMDHVLFHGPPGSARPRSPAIVAHELRRRDHAHLRPGDRAARRPGRACSPTWARAASCSWTRSTGLSPVVEEYLYPALEDFTLDILLDRGPSARSLKLNLERFTLVGRHHALGAAVGAAARALRRDAAARLLRAPTIWRSIVRRSAGILGRARSTTTPRSRSRGRARGTPRVANRLLRRVRDFALIKADGAVTLPGARARRCGCWRWTSAGSTRWTAGCSTR